MQSFHTRMGSWCDVSGKGGLVPAKFRGGKMHQKISGKFIGFILFYYRSYHFQIILYKHPSPPKKIDMMNWDFELALTVIFNKYFIYLNSYVR